MANETLPRNYIAVATADLAGPLGYVPGLLIVVPGSVYFQANHGGPAKFVPINRSGIWATLEDNGDLLVQVGPEAAEIVRTPGGLSTELQRLGVFTYYHGERLDFLGEA